MTNKASPWWPQPHHPSAQAPDPVDEVTAGHQEDRTPRLTLEIIPTSLHGKSPRTVLGRAWWDRTRKQHFAAVGNRCEICGGVGDRYPVEAHERYEYDETCRPPCQRVTGLIALCPDCHSVKHLFRTQAVARERNDPTILLRALDHLGRVNGWTKEEVTAYVKEAQAEFRRRESIGPWVQDMSGLPQ